MYASHAHIQIFICVLHRGCLTLIGTLHAQQTFSLNIRVFVYILLNDIRQIIIYSDQLGTYWMRWFLRNITTVDYSFDEIYTRVTRILSDIIFI